jgi:hypothetical protein
MKGSRQLLVAASTALLLVAIAAICLFFVGGGAGRLATILICYPGILINGLATDNFDGAFDSPVLICVTFLVSWAFWAVLSYLIMRAAVWLRIK